MTEIKTLTTLPGGDISRLIAGYTSTERYAVSRKKTADGWTFGLKRVRLPTPYLKRYDHVNLASIAQYQEMVSRGVSLGAFDAGLCIALAIATFEEWNKTYWVHELHVAASHQRRGIGRRIIDTLVANGTNAGMRTLLCETQNTNVPAIDFYLKRGFQLEGFDLTHYFNTDYPDGEIALTFKRALT